MTDIRSNVDRYGFERSEEFDYDSYEAFMSEYLGVLARRLKKWEKLMSSANGVSRSRKVKRYIRKGIPSDLRAEVWMNLSGADKMRDNDPTGYEKLLEKSKVDGESKLEKRTMDAIKGDIHRTFPENKFFQNEKDNLLIPLTNVLSAYAQYNPTVGYCQGLNYIVGMLLLQTRNETDSFWLLVQLLEHYIPDFYSSKMLALRVECSVLDGLMAESHPDLHAHFQNYGIDMQLFVSKWFVCIFMDVLPVETTLRIWDSLFYEGSKILLRAAFTLLVGPKDLFLLENDFTKICELFKKLVSGVSVMDCHAFMQRCFTVPKSFSRTKIKKLRENFTETLSESS